MNLAMRDPANRLAMCGGKKTYSGFKAHKVAQRMNRSRKVQWKVTPYRCAVCNQYHVGGRGF